MPNALEGAIAPHLTHHPMPVFAKDCGILPNITLFPEAFVTEPCYQATFDQSNHEFNPVITSLRSRGCTMYTPLPVNSLWHYNFIKLKRLITNIKQRPSLHRVGDRINPKSSTAAFHL